MDPRLNIITLAVSDLGKAREFYEKGLGWKVSSTSQTTIVFFSRVVLFSPFIPMMPSLRTQMCPPPDPVLRVSP